MPSKKEFLETILQYVEGISQENKDYLVSTLFKYDDNPVVTTIQDTIKTVAEAYNRYAEVYLEAVNTNSNKYILESRNTPAPVIILCSDSQQSLRVYPNLIVDNRKNLNDPSVADIKTLIAQYERDLTNPAAAVKWATPASISAHLLHYIDMPTARALTRYHLTDIKDTAVIRDFAEVMDNLRKPAELIFAETPEDFIEMYASGPSSCMGYGAGDRSNWAFFDEFNTTPPSWYAYYPYTKGAYLKKAGKVTARSIILQEPSTTRWHYGRIYPISTEAQKQFIDALKVHGIRSLETEHRTPEGTSFDIPGVTLKGGQVKCVWAYFDNVERADKGNWKCVYHKDTKVFSITYTRDSKNATMPTVNSRNGFLNATDYIHLECEYCHKAVSARNLLPAEDDKTFCSSNCANYSGYLKVIDGLGGQMYKKPDELQIKDMHFTNVRYSTLKAAYDNGLRPVITEAGVYPEDNSYVVSGQIRNQYNNTAGDNFGAFVNVSKFHKVPINLLAAKKVVEFTQEMFV